MEWKKGNTFGTTAFTSYGCSGLLLSSYIDALVWMVGCSLDWLHDRLFLLVWAVYLLYVHRHFEGQSTLQVVFGALIILFWLLAIRDYTGSATIGTIIGYEGVICGLSAIYAAAAQVLNEVYGKVVLPSCPVKK